MRAAMLKCKAIFNIEDKKQILQGFDPHQDAWVTADIKSRDFILHQLDGVTKDSSVFRASDFWKFLFSLLKSDYQTVSRSALIFLYQNWAKTQKKEWKKSPQTAAILCQYVYVLAHLLQHPGRDSLMQEWFAAHKKHLPYWKEWYLLAKDFWDYLFNKKIIESASIDIFLLDKTHLLSLPWRNIIFDLGFQIQQVEGELIRQLSSQMPVQLLVPVLEEGELREAATPPIYHTILKDHPDFKKQLNRMESTNTARPVTLRKWTTELAEVKDAVHTVSRAVKKGMAAHRIAVIAPYIEHYWPALKSYFKKEGIAINKKQVASLFSTPVVQLWLARMWTHLGVIRYENLETLMANSTPYTNFRKFKSWHSQAKQIEDIPSSCYQKNFLKSKHHCISGKEFTNWALDLLPGMDKKALDIQTAIKDCVHQIIKWQDRGHQSVNWEMWLILLENILKSREVLIQPEATTGIHCLSFNALGWLDADLVYVLGLNEQKMKQNRELSLSTLQADTIMQDMGFYIKENTDYLRSSILHFVQHYKGDIVLSCPENDFYGAALNPSGLWLEFYHAQKNKVSLQPLQPPKTAWDKQQRQRTVTAILQDKALSTVQIQRMEETLKADSGESALSAYYLNSLDQFPHLSHSLLSEYVKCPFIFAAERLFDLWGGEVRKIDRPPNERGHLIHRLFQEIKKEWPGGASLSEKQMMNRIEALYEEEKSKQKIFPVHPVMKKTEQSVLLKKAIAFLAHERERNALFPDYKTVRTEVEWQGYWDPKTNSLSPHKGKWPFRGTIDRVDSNGASYMAVDYKSRFPVGGVALKWADKYQFQLALYIQALEGGVTPLPIKPVDFAFFLSYKNFTWQGMVLKDKWQKKSFGGLSSRSHSLVSEAKKRAILQSINQQISRVTGRIQRGDFTPDPQDKTQCNKCVWRHICRAAHLQ